MLVQLYGLGVNCSDMHWCSLRGWYDEKAITVK